MKKVIKTMMMMLVASAFVLTSCKDTDDGENTIDDVKITLNPAATSGNHYVGDSLKIVVNAQGNDKNNLKKLTITKQVTGTAPETLVTQDLTGTDKIYTLTDLFREADADKSITYSIKVEGATGAAQTVNYVANVFDYTIVNVLPEPGHRMGSQLNDNPGEHFAQLINPFNIYDNNATQSDFADNIDMVYYRGTTNNHTIVSPSNAQMQQQIYSGIAHWGSARTTGFYRVPSADINLFNDVANAGDDKKLTPYAKGKTFTDIITNIAGGEVIIFKTEEGRLGLIKVKSVSGATAATGLLEFRVLAQAE